MNTSIKNLTKVLLLGSTFMLATTVVQAAGAEKGCMLKQQQIQKEIDYAKNYGNSYKQKGLETALANVKEHCTEASLKQEINEKIAEKQQKVNERESELKEAQANGDAKKIAKKQKKLLSAQQELDEAKKELSTYF